MVLYKKIISFIFASHIACAAIDDLHFDLKMPMGPFKGESLARKSDRPVINLRDEELSARSFDGDVKDSTDSSKSKILVANIFHRPHFYVAKIDLTKVKNVYYLFEKFMPLAAHTMVRFEMEPGHEIELIAKLPTQQEWKGGIKYHELEQPIKIADLVMSFDSEWVEGTKGAFNPINGVRGHYTSMFRFFSVQSFIKSFYLSRPYPVEQFRLNLKAEESGAYLRMLLDRSAYHGVDKGFNTFCNNCTTNPIEVLEESIPKREKAGWARRNVDRLFFNLLEKHPSIVPSVLWSRGWRDKGSQIENLERDPKLRADFDAAFDAGLERLSKMPVDSKKYKKTKESLMKFSSGKACLLFYY
ncbi:MAG: DUF4105 domain-containing protein [Bdellovibrionaceae bacterium]|nr:DUF4105 domain-containing protein [Pseudobdellovibrionaceae bacterium]